MSAARIYRKHDAQKRFYTELRQQFGLSAQPAIRVIGKVADAYATLHAGVAAGHYGSPGSTRRMKVLETSIQFRIDAAQPFDARCLSWQITDTTRPREATVSIWTVQGRLRDIRIVAARQHLSLLRTSKIGESDLVRRDGKWFLHATVKMAAIPASAPANGFVGVDLGIVNIATTSDGVRLSGARLNRYRNRQMHIRKRLQAKKTTSARRLLKHRRRKEARFASDINHKSVSASWRRLNAPGEESPSNSWAVFATGYGFVSPNGPRCIRGRSHSLAAFSPTRPKPLEWRSFRSTPRIRHRRVVHVGGSTRRTDARRASLNVAGVASLGTPITTQRSTSPSAALRAGAKSCVRTQRLP